MLHYYATRSCYERDSFAACWHADMLPPSLLLFRDADAAPAVVAAMIFAAVYACLLLCFADMLAACYDTLRCLYVVDVYSDTMSCLLLPPPLIYAILLFITPYAMIHAAMARRFSLDYFRRR